MEVQPSAQRSPAWPRRFMWARLLLVLALAAGGNLWGGPTVPRPPEREDRFTPTLVEDVASVGTTSSTEAEARAACQSGDGYACYALAIMARRGEVAGGDNVMIAALLGGACELGCMEACLDLGTAFENGDGVPRRADLARALFEHACASGVEEACFACARLPGPATWRRGDPASRHRMIASR